MTLSWAGTVVSAAFEDATSFRIEMDAQPQNKAHLTYNRFRIQVDDESPEEFGTNPEHELYQVSYERYDLAPGRHNITLTKLTEGNKRKAL